MRFLLGATLVLVLLYIVAGSAITSIVSIGEQAGESGGGRKLSYSPFKITFKDQFLCYAYDRGVGVMSDRYTDEDCKGPFIDSVSLCNAMAEEGVTRVRLYWEGRILECN